MQLYDASMARMCRSQHAPCTSLVHCYWRTGRASSGMRTYRDCAAQSSPRNSSVPLVCLSP